MFHRNLQIPSPYLAAPVDSRGAIENKYILTRNLECQYLLIPIDTYAARLDNGPLDRLPQQACVL